MFYVKRIVTVLLPYISISLIYVIYEHKKIDNLFFSLFYGSTEYHLWFMGTILRIYLMFPLILFILNRFKNKSKIINVFFVLLYLVFSFILIKNKDSIDNYVACLFTTKSDYHWKEFMSYSPIYLSIYFLLGYYFITYYEKVINFLFKNKKVISIFFIAIFIPRYLILMGNRIDIHFNNYIQTAVIMFFNIDSILFWYIVSEYMIEIKSKIAKLLRFISYYSFGAYLLHVLVLNVLAGIFYSYYHLTNNYIFPSVTLCILTIIITPVICHIVSNIPFSKYIFGVTKYKKY